MRVAEAVGRALPQMGVRDFFGLVGSGNFHLANALQASGARFVAARHETGAVGPAPLPRQMVAKQSFPCRA